MKAIEKEIYLDNAATTKVCREAAQAVLHAMTEAYGNPSSLHQKGFEAEKLLREAANTLEKLLKVDKGSLIYTSGATESNNWALFGTALAKQKRGRHIILSPIEHEAVSAPAAFLEEQGFEITRLKVGPTGRIDPAEVGEAIREDTILVSIMAVNNEIGTLQPLEQIAEIIHSKNPETLFHVDAVQAFGKYLLHPKKQGIDLLSVSSHKFFGPKGVGFLYKNPKVRILPILYGGGQQEGLRSGTENVPGISGMAAAAKRAYDHLEEERPFLYELKGMLMERLRAFSDIRIHGETDPDKSAPHILNVSFLGIRSEVLLHALEEKGIYVSSGSACSSRKQKGSATLRAIGCTREEMESSIRFSLSPENTPEEIAYTCDILQKIVPQLRRYRHG